MNHQGINSFFLSLMSPLKVRARQGNSDFLLHTQLCVWAFPLRCCVRSVWLSTCSGSQCIWSRKVLHSAEPSRDCAFHTAVPDTDYPITWELLPVPPSLPCPRGHHTPGLSQLHVLIVSDWHHSTRLLPHWPPSSLACLQSTYQVVAEISRLWKIWLKTYSVSLSVVRK